MPHPYVPLTAIGALSARAEFGTVRPVGSICGAARSGEAWPGEGHRSAGAASRSVERGRPLAWTRTRNFAAAPAYPELQRRLKGPLPLELSLVSA